jgi:hypothetical protein
MKHFLKNGINNENAKHFHINRSFYHKNDNNENAKHFHSNLQK